MKKHVKSITYEPKIKPVIDGLCTQTIRKGRKVSVGDEILFHGWSGRPYRSKWSWRNRVFVLDVYDITIDREMITFMDDNSSYLWNSSMAYTLAREDFIDPPTGEALRDVLFGLNGIPTEPEEYQIIRWTVAELSYSCGRCQPCPRDSSSMGIDKIINEASLL